jgi:ankyrin repeat protein
MAITKLKPSKVTESGLLTPSAHYRNLSEAAPFDLGESDRESDQTRAKDTSDNEDPSNNEDSLRISATDPYHQIFTKIIAEADQGLNLDVPEKRRKFLEDYKQSFRGQTRTTEKTLLHFIADVRHTGLTESVLEGNEDLLGRPDESDTTPLHLAIRRANIPFLRAVLREVRNLDQYLRIPGDHERNCIHAAILAKGLPPKWIIHLINKASEDTLQSVDQSGFTPLHLAVDYGRITKDSRDIVQALLKKGDAALDKENANANAEKLSVYQYHEHTRRLAEIKAQTPQPRNKPDTVKQPGPLYEASHGPQQSKRLEPLMGEANIVGSLDGGIVDSGRRSISPMPPLKEIVFASNMTPSKESRILSDQLARQPETQTATVNNSNERTSSQAQDEKHNQKVAAAEAIRLEIKLHYLRSTYQRGENRPRTQRQAIKFLYGKNTKSMSH